MPSAVTTPRIMAKPTSTTATDLNAMLIEPPQNIIAQCPYYFYFKLVFIKGKVGLMKKYLCALLLSLSLFASEPVEIVALGDSLTAGYGVEKESAWPTLLEGKLNKKKKNVRILNAGVSGSTTASGKSRLNWFLKKSNPKVLIVALGANDGLRGLKLEQSEKNLDEIIQIAKKNKIKILLTSMRLPPNYGKEYTQKFENMYSALRKKHDLPKMPFLLKDVGGVKELNIEDGIHPNEKGHEKIASNMLEHVEALL